MILHSLVELYERKKDLGEIAKAGWIAGTLDFLITVDREGDPVAFTDLREYDGKNYKSKEFYLPNIGKQSTKHSNSGKDANLLWDHDGFVFGLGGKGNLRLQSMIDAIDDFLPSSSSDDIQAVKKFLEKGQKDKKHFSFALEHEDYKDFLQIDRSKISFALKDSQYPMVFLHPDVEKALPNYDSEEGELGICLVTGENDQILDPTHPVIKNVMGAQTTGASIVSFNCAAFESYGLKQSFNAPVSKRVTEKYTKALNRLLVEEKHRIRLAGSTIVFWSQKESSFEDDFAAFFEESPKDDPSKNIEKIKSLFDAVHSGAFVREELSNKFYVLGLAPNSARLSIRFFTQDNVADFAHNITRYFSDFEIVKSNLEPEYYSIWRILVSIAVLGKSENIPPNIAGEFFQSILSGTPYPASLYQACLRRIKADTAERVKPVRVALLKAYLNRYHSYYRNKNFKEVEIALDKNQESIGYQLGRLFAVLEKIQEEANPGLNATIADRYYSAASSTPVSVFATLLRLKVHHLSKLENKGRVVNLEKMLGEIMQKINEFPAHLNMVEQGMFSIGYYHQRQSFYVKANNEGEGGK